MATKEEMAALDAHVGITIAVDADLDLKVSELWPDGDVPGAITAEGIAEMMRKQGTKTQVLIDWCLVDDVSVSVRVDAPNPAFSQHETLFGEAPDPRLVTRVREVWDR